jgi:hypothetical protein
VRKTMITGGFLSGFIQRKGGNNSEA